MFEKKNKLIHYCIVHTCISKIEQEQHETEWKIMYNEKLNKNLINICKTNNYDCDLIFLKWLLVIWRHILCCFIFYKIFIRRKILFNCIFKGHCSILDIEMGINVFLRICYENNYFTYFYLYVMRTGTYIKT